MSESEQENDKDDWQWFVLFIWFCYCFWTIYEGYYEYNFYYICGKLEAQTILFFVIYLITKGPHPLNTLEKWIVLFKSLLKFSIFYIPILILLVKTVVKIQDYYYSFKNSDFYYYISQFMYGLIHSFSS